LMVGSKVPLHATAIGKLYLAFKPELAEKNFRKN
jgi:DNA-binding IclR family transcriptional regulator